MTELHEKSLRRVLFVSGLNGWVITLSAGLFTVISLVAGGWMGVTVVGIITGCGVLELMGRRRLRQGDAGGMRQLVQAQLIILMTVLLYVFQNLLAYDEATLMAGLTPDMITLLDQSGISVETLRGLLKPAYFGLYLGVMGLSLLHQGGLALFYQTQRAKVPAALPGKRPLVPPSLG